jgi:hypothetical protein
MMLKPLLAALPLLIAFDGTAQVPSPDVVLSRNGDAAVIAPATQRERNGSYAGDSLFRRLDRDGNGYLSPNELEAADVRNGGWVAMDRNGDGRIARSEFQAVPGR